MKIDCLLVKEETVMMNADGYYNAQQELVRDASLPEE